MLDPPKRRERGCVWTGMTNLRASRSKIALVLGLAALTGCTSEAMLDSEASELGGTLIPSGPYTDWSFRTDLYNLDSHTTITIAPPANATEFWSTQFGFVNGDGGYMGIQNAGWFPDGHTGKLALVSIWGAIGAQPIQGTCSTFVEGGSGYTCRLPYEWVVGHDYQFRAWVVGAGQWLFALADKTTGVERQLGIIKVPASWGWIARGSVINWTEYFAANDPNQRLVQCNDLPQVAAQFRVSGNGDTETPTLAQAHVSDADCHNTLITLDAPNIARQWFGGKNNSWLAPGQTLGPNEGLWSPDGRTVLVNQTDGNVVVYPDGRALWASRTANGVGGTLIMQTDGNLVLYSPQGGARWHTNTWGRVITNLTVQNDCNVVLYQNGAAIWHTQTHGCVSRL